MRNINITPLVGHLDYLRRNNKPIVMTLSDGGVIRGSCHYHRVLVSFGNTERLWHIRRSAVQADHIEFKLDGHIRNAEEDIMEAIMCIDPTTIIGTTNCICYVRDTNFYGRKCGYTT